MRLYKAASKLQAPMAPVLLASYSLLLVRGLAMYVLVLLIVLLILMIAS